MYRFSVLGLGDSNRPGLSGFCLPIYATVDILPQSFNAVVIPGCCTLGSGPEMYDKKDIKKSQLVMQLDILLSRKTSVNTFVAKISTPADMGRLLIGMIVKRAALFEK